MRSKNASSLWTNPEIFSSLSERTQKYSPDLLVTAMRVPGCRVSMISASAVGLFRRNEDPLTR
jgi:hypothetical protein